MSEYQYYEFRAVDCPLTPRQMNELRSLSSRAEITTNRFSNTYHYGDFRGDPRKLMESCFDAHVYVSNFGTVTLMLRLPRSVITDKTLTQYASNDCFDWRLSDEHTILEWQRDEEPQGGWVEGDGWIDQLLPIRDELVRGDYRSLYIGWLSTVTNKSTEDEEKVSDTSRREPPVPAGLGSLTEPQVALAKFLSVESDLITAAAEASPAISAKNLSDQKAAAWVAQLPEQEVRAIITRIIQGEASRVQTELQSRYYRSREELTGSDRAEKIEPGRTAADLVARAAQITRERKRQESEEQARKRHAQLAELIPRFSELWATADGMAQEKTGTSYDKVCSLLVDLRDAYAQANCLGEFDAEFVRFLGKYSRSTALARRLKEVRLLP